MYFCDSLNLILSQGASKIIILCRFFERGSVLVNALKSDVKKSS